MLSCSTAGERKEKALHDTKEIHRKQPKARTARGKSGGVSQATNERGDNFIIMMDFSNAFYENKRN